MITFFSRVEKLLPCKYKEKLTNIKEIKSLIALFL